MLGVIGAMSEEVHRFGEINLLIGSETEELVYRYEINQQTFECKSPCSVLIPAESPHRMMLLAGSGTFVCIRLTS